LSINLEKNVEFVSDILNNIKTVDTQSCY